MVLYKLKLPWIEKYKGGEEPWPWQCDPEWNSKLIRMLKLTVLNLVITYPIGYIVLVVSEPTLYEVDELPSLGLFLFQMLWMMVMEDFTFYWSHKLLHHPKLYPYIHKVHHESKSTISLSAIATHPAEYFLGNVIPTAMGISLCPGKIHIITSIIFVYARLIDTIEGHSGYDFPYTMTRWMPLTVTSNYHNYHHLVNIGNYASQFTIWDSIFGSNTSYYEHVEKELKTKDKGSMVKLRNEYKLKEE